MENKERSNRLAPVKAYIFKKGLSMAELSRRCKKDLSRHGISYRMRVGDCSLEDMEDMAQAAGYRFAWHWEDVRPVEPSKRSVRPMTKLNNDRLKPVLEYLFLKNISIPDLANKLGITRGGLAFRLKEGSCMMSDMEEMADAAGYRFVWDWEELSV